MIHQGNDCTTGGASTETEQISSWVREDSCNISKPTDLYSKSSDRSAIWRASRQNFCWGACQIIERPDNLNLYYIMTLMKFADLSQSDRSNWVIWQVKDPCPWQGMDVWPGKKSYKNCKKKDNIALYLISFLKSTWKNKTIRNRNTWTWYLFFLSML